MCVCLERCETPETQSRSVGMTFSDITSIVSIHLYVLRLEPFRTQCTVHNPYIQIRSSTSTPRGDIIDWDWCYSSGSSRVCERQHRTVFHITFRSAAHSQLCPALNTREEKRGQTAQKAQPTSPGREKLQDTDR